MTENRISSSNHVGNSLTNQKGYVFHILCLPGYIPTRVLYLSKYLPCIFVFRDVDKTIDDIGWKSKLKLPPKDRRIKTSVSLIYPHWLLIDFEKNIQSVTCTSFKAHQVCFAMFTYFLQFLLEFLILFHRMLLTQEVMSLKSFAWNENCLWVYLRRDGRNPPLFKRLLSLLHSAVKMFSQEPKMELAKLALIVFQF